MLYLESGRLQNAANASVVPTEFAAEPTTKMKSSKKKFRNLNFSPSTIYRYLIFTPPSGRGLVIPFFFITPPSGRGLAIPVFLPRRQDGV